MNCSFPNFSFLQHKDLVIKLENKSIKLTSTYHFHSSNRCITNVSSADEDFVLSSSTKISVLAESGTDSKMDVSVDNPHEFEKHVGAAFLTGSVVETRNANFTSSENGI